MTIYNYGFIYNSVLGLNVSNACSWINGSKLSNTSYLKFWFIKMKNFYPTIGHWSSELFTL